MRNFVLSQSNGYKIQNFGVSLMNKIQVLHQKVLQELPGAQVNFEDNKVARYPDKCSWFLNVSLRGLSVSVEWRPGKEPLIICNCGVYGCAGDMTCVEPDDALRIIKCALVHKS